MKSLLGHSGVVHEFTEVAFPGPKVLQTFCREVSVVDVLDTRAKTWDVGASSVLLKGPCITREAAILAKEYGFRVVVG